MRKATRGAIWGRPIRMWQPYVVGLVRRLGGQAGDSRLALKLMDEGYAQFITGRFRQTLEYRPDKFLRQPRRSLLRQYGRSCEPDVGSRNRMLRCRNGERPCLALCHTARTAKSIAVGARPANDR